jgi:cytochrome c peroxidase
MIVSDLENGSETLFGSRGAGCVACHLGESLMQIHSHNRGLSPLESSGVMVTAVFWGVAS